MASVDGARSLQGASDEMYDNICGPCKLDNVEKGANHYCVDCGEYLCNQCKDYHRKFAVTKTHKIVPDSKVRKSVSVSQGPGLVIYCGCNKNQEVEFYCEDHEEVVCNPCKNIKHHKCKTSSVQEKSASYTTATFNSILSKVKTLKDKYDQMKEENSKAGIIKELKLLKEACKKEIKTFRKDLDIFLDKLEQKMLENLDRLESEQQQRIDQQLSTVITASQMLDSDYKLLENAKKDGRKTMMFKSDVHVSKSIHDYESRLTDLEKDVIKPTLSFKRNKKLDDLQTEINALGFLKGNEKSDRKVLLGKQIQSHSQVNVRSGDDKKYPQTSGCAVLPKGHTVLCDHKNHTFKLMDTSLVLQESLKLSSWPYDVSIIDDSNAIITLPGKKQLQYIQVLPQLKAGRVIQLDRNGYGVEVSGDEIYTSCHNDPGQGEVRVLDLNGNMKRRLGVNQYGSFMFTKPYYITVSPSGRKIYVSDAGTSTVTCMTVDGNIIYQYKDDGLDSPRGLYVDAGDNIFVCGRGFNNVQVIKADGRKYETLLSSSDGIMEPSSIAYRGSDNTLVVGCRDQNNALLFKLTL